jgi:membrane protease YdiL (CAAX protease family)
LAAGFASLGAVSAIQLAAGAREWALEAGPAELAGKLAVIVVSALLIGCLEETAARGVLFRVLARLWSFWPAALFSSALFAYVHYLEPAPYSFGQGTVMEQTWAVLVSTLTKPGRTPCFLINFANLTLMSFVLCTVVLRTGTVWMAVGLHAGWVALTKFNYFSADAAWHVAVSRWIGRRADATDALLTCAILVLLAIAAAVLLPRGRTA